MKINLNNRTRTVMAVLIALSAAAFGCSSSSSDSGNPGAPSGNTSGSGCRTYATAATVSATSGGTTIVSQLAGTFNTSTLTATVTTTLVNGGGLCSTTVSTYRSVADFVDEVKTVPGVLLPTQGVTTNTAICGGTVVTTSYTYDSQRRLTTLTNLGGTTTYTAWDSAGRPTAGTFPGTTVTLTHNESTRTTTQTQTGAAPATTTTTYDANGIQLTATAVTPAGTSSTVFNNTSTAQVCK